jgi:soluble lytic murein transglycosylase-like protein
MKRVLPAFIVALGLASPALANESQVYTIHDAQRDNQLQLEILAGQTPPQSGEEYARLDAAQPAPVVAKSLPAKTEVHKLVTKYAQKHGIDPALAHAIVKVESNYNCNAKNPRSTATGIMQTLVPTARGVGVTGNLRDCSTSLEAGMRYLKQAVEKHGAGCAGASAYNLGHYGSSRCTGYGKKVMGIASRMNVAGVN